eukprot:CAMPEP_0172674254 /NCGR_PEP_ID=MMETSP1074-20121228/12637_1 /TAXON_ID=2916 /ORGANISM="Ceratium fusus, Strain PA161109" /LENGTH=145 /DNA_ID=CAMNT_0013491653 /DNA_START=945 /DNA_END=1383 /DNA_ORIENTATION=+
MSVNIPKHEWQTPVWQLIAIFVNFLDQTRRYFPAFVSPTIHREIGYSSADVHVLRAKTYRPKATGNFLWEVRPNSPNMLVSPQCALEADGDPSCTMPGAAKSMASEAVDELGVTASVDFLGSPTEPDDVSIAYLIYNVTESVAVQ